MALSATRPVQFRALSELIGRQGRKLDHSMGVGRVQESGQLLLTGARSDQLQQVGELDPRYPAEGAEREQLQSPAHARHGVGRQCRQDEKDNDADDEAPSNEVRSLP
jgi:hypothetical protein